MKRRDVTYRISVRLSQVCETDGPPSLSPKASANLSTHWMISCANRSVVPFASMIVYTIQLQYYNRPTVTMKIAYRSQFDEVG